MQHLDRSANLGEVSLTIAAPHLDSPQNAKHAVERKVEHDNEHIHEVLHESRSIIMLGNMKIELFQDIRSQQETFLWVRIPIVICLFQFSTVDKKYILLLCADQPIMV
jgi:hypothetical protein